VLLAVILLWGGHAAMMREGAAEPEHIAFGDGVSQGRYDIQMPVPSGPLPQFVTINAEGHFAPERNPAGEASVLVVDDDMERWYSGPYIESTHILTALNDNQYSFDVFRAGSRHGINYELPAGDAGLSLLDDYEVVIWYSGWNTAILTDNEEEVLMDYLDGEEGSDEFHTDNRNILFMTQMSDWMESYSRDFYAGYLHADASGIGGTARPVDGVDDSIFDGRSYSTDHAGQVYPSRPLRQSPTDAEAMGCLWMDPGHASHKYHAIQYPETESGTPQDTDYKSVLFADEFGVFGQRDDRADFIATVLDWMEVDPATQKQVDVGIGGLDIPLHGTYRRLVEANVEDRLRVFVVNYGYQTLNQVGVNVRIFNEYDRLLYDTTLWSNTDFEDDPDTEENEGSPGNLLPGETWAATFNLTNARLQAEDDGEYPNAGAPFFFSSSGMNSLEVTTLYYGGDKEGANADQYAFNDRLLPSVGVAKWVEGGEWPEDELGPAITFVDTEDNDPSLDRINAHRTQGYDWDMNPSSANETGRNVVHSGQSCFAYFKSDGWKKSNGDRVYTPEPNQDDAIVSPEMDLSSMEEAILGFWYSGRMDDDERWRVQVQNESDEDWYTIFEVEGHRSTKGSWLSPNDDHPNYVGLEVPEPFYGHENNQVQFRFQYLADGDEDTDDGNGNPHLGILLDTLALMGAERITHDVAVTDVSMRADNFRVHTQTDAYDRELNTTVTNVGSSSWTELPVEVSITNLQGEEVYSEVLTIPGTLSGHTFFGDIEAEDHEAERELFIKFLAPETNVYFATFTARTPAGKDQAPANNSMTVEFQVHDTFFYDDAEDEELDLTDNQIEWSTTDTHWYQVNPRDYGRGYAHSGQKAYYLTAPPEGEEYEPGADVGMVTPDEFDRDGDNTRYELAPAIDLVSAYKPELIFWYQLDLGLKDRFRVQVSTHHDDGEAPDEADWITIFERTGAERTPGWGSSFQWQQRAVDLSDYRGHRVWLQFRLTADGNDDVGEGVLIDDIWVRGAEYHNNLQVTGHATQKVIEPGGSTPLVVTIQNQGKTEQSEAMVEARLLDAKGEKVWPTDAEWLEGVVPESLARAENYTLNGSEDEWSDWRWGEDLEAGLYYLHFKTHLADDPSDEVDESPLGNHLNLSLVVGYLKMESQNWSGGSSWEPDASGRGIYRLKEERSGELIGEPFTIDHLEPIYLTEAHIDLDGHEIQLLVRAQEREEDWTPWYYVRWRDVRQESTLYSDTNWKGNQTAWTQGPYFHGWSSEDGGRTIFAYYAELGAVKELSEGGRLKETYLGGMLQLKFEITLSGRSVVPRATFFEPLVYTLTERQNKRPTAYIESISYPAVEGEPLYLNASGNDPDGSIVQYQWSSDRDGSLGHTEYAEFMLNNLTAGYHTIRLWVQDDSGDWSEPDQITLEVLARPVATILSIIPDPVELGRKVTFSGIGHGPSAIIGSEWYLSGTYLSDKATFTTKVWNKEAGSHLVSFRVQDANGVWSDWETYLLTLELSTNQAPQGIISDISPNPAREGQEVTLICQALDPDGTVVSYRWTSDLDGPLGNDIILKLENLSVGEHEISLTVKDDYGTWSESNIATLVVRPGSVSTGDDDDDSGPLGLGLWTWVGLCLLLVAGGVIGGLWLNRTRGAVEPEAQQPQARAQQQPVYDSIGGPTTQPQPPLPPPPQHHMISQSMMIIHCSICSGFLQVVPAGKSQIILCPSCGGQLQVDI